MSYRATLPVATLVFALAACSKGGGGGGGGSAKDGTQTDGAGPGGQAMSTFFGNLYFDGAEFSQALFSYVLPWQGFTRGAFNEDMYTNTVRFAPGVAFTATTGSGNVAAGDVVKIYPGLVKSVPYAADDCSDSLKQRLLGVRTEIGSLPPTRLAGDSKVKAAIGVKPTGMLQVKIIDGDPVP